MSRQGSGHQALRQRQSGAAVSPPTFMNTDLSVVLYTSKRHKVELQCFQHENVSAFG